MGSNSSMLLVEHMFQTKGCIPSVVDKQPQGHHLHQQKVVGPIIFVANEAILRGNWTTLQLLLHIYPLC